MAIEYYNNYIKEFNNYMKELKEKQKQLKEQCQEAYQKDCLSSSSSLFVINNKQKEIIEKLINQINQLENFKKSVVIEKEDEKQKIIKITKSASFDNLNSDVTIVYGDIKANQINAKNVICIKGNIDGSIAADRVVGVPNVKDAQTDFRNHHKKCQYCKFYKEKKNFSFSISSYYQCEVSGNILKKNKARFCKYYEVK